METEKDRLVETSRPIESAEKSQLGYAMVQVDEARRSKKKQRRWGLYVGVVLTAIMLVAGMALVLNREWVYDFYLGISYTPSIEMEGIRDSLDLTERGKFIFNAAQPELNEAEAFNSYCRTALDMEDAVLGCYTNGKVYIYNIVDEELEGIRELTTAHELLHAVWARMSDSERSALVSALGQVLVENQDFLEDEIMTYDEAMRQEELYVRVGTEVANLPAILEKHYAEIFENQDAVVNFYDGYIAVFREIKAEMAELEGKMNEITAEIDAKTVEYERQFAQFNADIVSFNACANVEGCFKSEAEFYSRRSVLIAKQEGLVGMYEEINGLVDDYNALVVQYNADITRSEKLNKKINSNEKVKEIE